jgi:hypothetical protein
LTQLPDEVHVHILSFLRCFDLGPVQQTCRFYNDPGRIHDVVTQFVNHVYGTEYTGEIVEMIDASVANDSNNSKIKSTNGKKPNDKNHHCRNKKNTSRKHPLKSSTSSHNGDTNTDTDIDSGEKATNSFRYTLGHLRSVELAVVARVLSRPEPKTGYFVSKSWIKKTLLWLEKVNDPTTFGASTTTTPKKKLTKKQERQRNRRLSDISAPWPNANSDILCEHQNLQRSGAKAARSHRKLMDKKSWAVLRKLYPDSTQLESVQGECLQCLMEAETARKDEQDRLEQQKLERKRPLSNPNVRRFYTRTRGVPYHSLAEKNNEETTNEDSSSSREEDGRELRNGNENEFGDDGGGKRSATDARRDSSSHSLSSSSIRTTCPLPNGKYVILPRAWCHQWRRYIKTGEGCMPLPPDSSALLCDAHKLALLPVRFVYAVCPTYTMNLI